MIRPARAALAVLALAACTLAVSCVPAPAPRGAPGGDASAVAGCAVQRVVDGDTLDMTCPTTGAFRARLVGHDTPESHEPGCAAEARAAAAATARLRALVAQSGGAVEARLLGFDRYDRRLVALRLGGRDVGETLIAEGLAVPYSGGRRIDWCAVLG